MATPHDITGMRFTRLVALRVHTEMPINQQTLWECQCDCGNTHLVNRKNLIGNFVRSCGCLVKESIKKASEANFTHRHAKTSIYRIWGLMKTRCNNPSNPAYPQYGGRGIKVCERWEKFENFLADMGERPLGMSLDRYPDVNGNYEPSNCRWATRVQQANNRTDSCHVTFNGKTLTYAEWEAETGIKQGAIRKRLLAGWDVEKALTQPTKVYNKEAK
ncbi:hypothetical protein [Paraburkholderia monticola]|uniref:hypothetical protein n=1 Tax=Paraburkholderia monticola TaxID=1399968 RepID=UPI0009501883|nr:hypothetical protein [Paraburkholderia monticola]